MTRTNVRIHVDFHVIRTDCMRAFFEPGLDRLASPSRAPCFCRRFAPKQVARLGAVVLIAALAPVVVSSAQVTASIDGTVFDESGAAITGASIAVQHTATRLQRAAMTNEVGRYRIAGVEVGDYRVVVSATGFRSQVVERLQVEVGRDATQDFTLSVGEMTQEVTVAANATISERATFAAGALINRAAIETTPLNGGHFVDLALLTPGAVTPPQNGALSPPQRGLGTFTVNTGGNREDATNFLVNGVNMNDLLTNILILQPTLSVLQEFRIDTSTPSAEFGRTSGAVVNIVTRSGSNDVHGSGFELFRDDALDARNYFRPPSLETPPLRRHQFGVGVGGPIVRDRTFFFAAYEGVRQEQGLDVNTVVLSDAQRAAIVDPTIRRLATLVPRSNATDSRGTPRYVGFAAAPVSVDQAAIDVMQSVGRDGRLHGFFAIQTDDSTEPFLLFNTIPGFGFMRSPHRQVFSLSFAQSGSHHLFNEARFGFNRFAVDVTSPAGLTAASFGLAAGADPAAPLPQFNVAGAFNFGGPTTVPQGRRDTSWTVSDTASYLHGSHALKFGGEFRTYVTDSYQRDPGTFNFPNIAAFVAGTANSFTWFSGDRASYITQRGLGLFAQDAYRWRPDVTAEIGIRYEWNISPAERDNRFVVFDSPSVSLVRVGVDTHGPVYRQNAHNVEPRVGLAWTRDAGRTILRGGFAVTVQQPTTNEVNNLPVNPPFGTPLTITGPVKVADAFQSAQSAGLAPLTVQPDFTNATFYSWNATLHRELLRNFSATISYVASRGRHLPIVLNINQPDDGVRPYPALSNTSPILPGAALGNIIEAASQGRSSYNALWVTMTRRLAQGLMFDGSYTLSSSIDYNSLTQLTTRVAVQDSYNPSDSQGPSDFDARHRYVGRATYALPWRRNPWLAGWQLSTVIQGQSGNPVNIVTTSSAVNGTANTLRPDLTGPITILGRIDQWFDTSVFAAVNHFGNAPRNAVIGPRFDNVDASVGKRTSIGATTVELRADVFNVLNHPNFGQPGNVVGSPDFGRITNTRNPAGDIGSSRQIQLVAKVEF